MIVCSVFSYRVRKKIGKGSTLMGGVCRGTGTYLSREGKTVFAVRARTLFSTTIATYLPVLK